MNRENFKKILIEKCSLDKNLSASTELSSMEDWDSLALISVMATFNIIFKFTPELTSLQNCKTMDDILDLANNYYEE